MLPKNHSPTQAKSVCTQPAATAKWSSPSAVSTSVAPFAPAKAPGTVVKRTVKHSAQASQNMG